MLEAILGNLMAEKVLFYLLAYGELVPMVPGLFC